VLHPPRENLKSYNICYYAQAESEPRAKMRKPQPKEWTASERQKLSKMAKRGERVSKIAAELGRHAGSVRRMARSIGLLLKK